VVKFNKIILKKIMERITATYLIETPLAVDKAAQILAGEQSSGTFIAVPGETEALKQRFAATVEQIQIVDKSNNPAIPSEKITSNTFNKAIIKVSWNVENFGYNLPVIVSTIQGNLYELQQFTGLKLLDVDFPVSFAEHYKGPSFGVAGCRRLTKVNNLPIIGTIIKPSVGLSINETVDIVKKLISAGIDFIKDDELLSSSANSNFFERVTQVMEVINKNETVTGKKVMYAFNLSGEMDEMQHRYEHIVTNGGTCAMVNINSVGISATKKIADIGKLVIHGHRNGWGMLNRHPLLGIDFKAYQKIWRLVGIDQMHVNGIDNKFWESDDSVVASMKACATPFYNHINPLPVVSSGQWGGQAFETYKRVPTTDVLYMAGGGIMAHPNGAVAGVAAIQEAWQAAIDGLTLQQATEKYKNFKLSVQKFGK
jgi:ribulose-bisphosphate carboxylase large chain